VGIEGTRAGAQVGVAAEQGRSIGHSSIHPHPGQPWVVLRHGEVEKEMVVDWELGKEEDFQRDVAYSKEAPSDLAEVFYPH
jgi:hypothetical protein